jgi:anti-sigma B factor antagonist
VDERDDWIEADRDARGILPSSLHVVRRDDVTIIAMEGEADVFAAPSLREWLNAEIGCDRPCIVDLRDVTFIDASVLSALLAAKRRSDQRLLPFAVLLDPEDSPIRRLMTLTMVTLPIIDSLESGLPAAPAR